MFGSARAHTAALRPARLLMAMAIVLISLALGPAAGSAARSTAQPIPLVVLEFDTALTSLNLSGGDFAMPLASDPGNALPDSIDGFGFVNSRVTITLSSQRSPNPGPASTGRACAVPFFAPPGGDTAGASDFCPPGDPPAIDPAQLDGQGYAVFSFFDVFFDISVTDVDPRPGRNFAGMPGGATIVLPDNRGADMRTSYLRRFEMNAPNFGLVPPPEVSPYIGHFDIRIPLGGDINGNSCDDMLKFTLATHAVGGQNRTFVTLPDGTVIDSFGSAADLKGAVVDVINDPNHVPPCSADPTFEIGAINPNTGLPDPLVFGGPTTATSHLRNPILPGVMKQDVPDQLVALRGSATDKHDRDGLDDAIKHLTRSLDPALWTDGSHLTPMHGEKVFNEERDTVKALDKLIKDKKSALDKGLLQVLSGDLTRADRALAATAISDAIAAAGDPAKIARANDELAKGDADATKGNSDAAIDHYRKAWQKAQEAM